MIKVLLLVIALFALNGCSILSPNQPLDSNAQEAAAAQREAQSMSNVNLANGYILLSQVRMMAANALKSKIITVDDAKQFLQLTDDARKVLDSARDMHLSGDKDAARKGLEIADVLIGQVRVLIEGKIQEKAKVKP